MTEPTSVTTTRTGGRRIVVGLDSSPEAAAALRWARACSGPDDTLVAVRAWDVRTLLETGDPDAVDTAGFAEVVAEALDRTLAEFADVTATPVVRRGRSGPVLVDVAADADLIVVGHRGDGRIALMLGSTANYVLHHATCPVAIVRGAGAAPPQRVVVGIDSGGSDGASNESIKAVRWAYELPGVEQVTLVHGWFLPPLAVGMFTVPELHVDALAASAAAVIDTVAEAAGPVPEGLVVERRAVRAPAGVALAEASRDADLVVVGSRGQGALRGLLLGSTSAALAARAESPVVVVR